MADIIPWPRHTRQECNHPDGDYTHCGYCMGGLFMCSVCGGAEGELTTDCCGHSLTPAVREQCYAGRLNYTRRNGWMEGMTCRR